MGMEWTTPSPPPKDNFDEVPVVTEEAYAYHKMTPQGGHGPILPPAPLGQRVEQGPPTGASNGADNEPADRTATRSLSRRAVR